MREIKTTEINKKVNDRVTEGIKEVLSSNREFHFLDEFVEMCFDFNLDSHLENKKWEVIDYALASYNLFLEKGRGNFDAKYKAIEKTIVDYISFPGKTKMFEE